MNRLTRSNPDVVPSMDKLKATSRTSHDPSFDIERTDSNNYIPKSAWEVALSDKSHPWSEEKKAATNGGVPV